MEICFAFLAALLSPAMAGGIAYLPTRILSSRDDLLYVFRPPTPTSSRSLLQALNTSRRLDSANIEYSTLSDPLPFLNDEDGEAFTATIDDEGKIMVYAGKCQEGAEAATFWMFTLSNGTNAIDGTWRQRKLGSAITEPRYTQGANYLASGMTFSSTVNSKPAMIVFGGMCPDNDQSTGAGWIKSAKYSNAMVTIQATSSPSESIYNLSNSTSRGPPIPEAGFTLTPLEPTYSQTSESQNRNQNFVLLGGHTQKAFINMSQVALFSLPEQAWTYLPVNLPPIGPKTYLTRDVPLVEPRSGHTAVLTPDGRKIVVFGGWVGDVTSRATPQLAVLELGAGYGGDGSWQWTIPTVEGVGPEDGVGIFGHGAVMLPGGVMMIAGGYLIPKSRLERRLSGLALNSVTYFFNTTSNSWIPSFDPPHRIIQPGNSTDPTVAKATVKKVGLQAGLTLGVLALLGLLCFYFWYTRRTSNRRQNREKELRSLAADAHRIDPSVFHVGSPICEIAPVDWTRDQVRPSTDAYPWAPVQTANVDERVRGNVGQKEAERTGLLFEVPSPTRGLRRSLYSRVAYQPAPRFDDGRLSHGPGNIHPIDERDEYEEENGDGGPLYGPGNRLGRDISLLDSAPILDPFRDTRESSRSPSPESPMQARELEVQSWVNDWAAADALMHQNAVRLPAEKNDRTSSTLSDRSTRSTISTNSYLQAGASVSRSLSQRSSVLLGTRPLSSHNNPTLTTTVPFESQANPKLPPGYNPNHRRTRSLTLFTGSRGAQNAISNNKSSPKSFPQLQLESEALLGGYHIPSESSPTKLQNRARGWMGSVRRALVGGGDRSTEGYTERRGSLTSSPTKYYQHSINTPMVPRRAASTGAMLWKKKQGAKDWDIEDGSNDLKTSDLTMSHDDGDWDIESAVERRVVQVMFTVPREKLRVVNRGPDGDGVSTFSAELVDPAKEEDRGPGKAKDRDKRDDEV